MNTKNLKEKTTTRKIVGIDYSLTSPAVCVTENFEDSNTWYYYLTNKKKYIGPMRKNILGIEHEEYNDPIQRFTQISDFVFKVLSKHLCPSIGDRIFEKVYIEGYSFGSKGQGIFQIAENCGILKYRLQEQSIPYETVVPSVVKKGATGKGNADKELMYGAFEKEQINLRKVFDTEKITNPVSDIVDSFYIAKVGYENSISHNTK